ncbi:hypothetical protein HDV00_000377 [Rhizophlyctis rosea]|nr:hypothetical protein HDV00_000377 [Rhizophlyctis rosea]
MDETVFFPNRHETLGLELFRTVLETLKECAHLELDIGKQSMHAHAVTSAAIWIRGLSQSGWGNVEQEVLQRLLTSTSFVEVSFLSDLTVVTLSSAPALCEHWMTELLPGLLWNPSLSAYSKDAIGALYERLLRSSFQPKDARRALTIPQRMDAAHFPDVINVYASLPDGAHAEITSGMKKAIYKAWNELSNKLEEASQFEMIAPSVFWLTKVAQCITRFTQREDVSDMEQLEPFIDVLTGMVEGMEEVFELAFDQPDLSSSILLANSISGIVMSISKLLPCLNPERRNAFLEIFEKWRSRGVGALQPLEVYDTIPLFSHTANEQCVTKLLEAGLRSGDWLVVHEALVATVSYAAISPKGPPQLSQASREMVVDFISKKADDKQDALENFHILPELVRGYRPFESGKAVALLSAGGTGAGQADTSTKVAEVSDDINSLRDLLNDPSTRNKLIENQHLVAALLKDVVKACRELVGRE